MSKDSKNPLLPLPGAHIGEGSVDADQEELWCSFDSLRAGSVGAALEVEMKKEEEKHLLIVQIWARIKRAELAESIVPIIVIYLKGRQSRSPRERSGRSQSPQTKKH